MCTGLNIDIWAYFLPYFRLTEHFFQNQALTSCWGSSKDEVPDVGQLAGYGRMCIPNTEGSINIVVTIVYREISPVVCGFSMPGYIHEHAHAHTHTIIYIDINKVITYIHTYTYTSRRKRYRRAKMIKITTSSQRGASFCIQNLSKKRSVYFGNDNPSITSASKRETATFSHIEDHRA